MLAGGPRAKRICRVDLLGVCPYKTTNMLGFGETGMSIEKCGKKKRCAPSLHFVDQLLSSDHTEAARMSEPGRIPNQYQQTAVPVTLGF